MFVQNNASRNNGTNFDLSLHVVCTKQGIDGGVWVTQLEPGEEAEAVARSVRYRQKLPLPPSLTPPPTG